MIIFWRSFSQQRWIAGKLLTVMWRKMSISYQSFWFLVSPPVLRACMTVVGRYQGRWELTVALAALAVSTEQGLFPRGRGSKQMGVCGEQLKGSRHTLTRRDHVAEMRSIIDKSVFMQIIHLQTAKSFWLLFVCSGCLWSCQWGGFETRPHCAACSTAQLFLLLQSLPTSVSV